MQALNIKHWVRYKSRQWGSWLQAHILVLQWCAVKDIKTRYHGMVHSLARREAGDLLRVIRLSSIGIITLRADVDITRISIA